MNSSPGEKEQEEEKKRQSKNPKTQIQIVLNNSS